MALLKKDEDAAVKRVRPYPYKGAKLPDELGAFIKDAGLNIDKNRIEIHEDRVFYMPEGLPDLKGLRIVRAGLFMGNMKKKRFEPSQPMAMAFADGEGYERINISVEDENLIRYLKCETIQVEGKKGDVLICVEGKPLGFGKLANGTLKNKYRPSWRWMRG